MSSCRDRIVGGRAAASVRPAVLLAATLTMSFLVLPGPAAAQVSTYENVGRPATPSEIAAWDIDVRPDLRGLPTGSGTVEQGMAVWETKCASCHGVFGESNEVFAPIVGGTGKDDLRTGRAARLADGVFPGRTTLMKLPTISTLWDYINRAMPWNAPKTLTVDEVYAVTAYILNLGEIVPADFTLSDRTMADVQQRLPNRDGMTTDHALWPGAGFGNQAPDVAATACMTGCATDPKVASFLPDFARNAHGNLAEQNRRIGPQRGADTTQPPPATLQQSVQRQAALAEPARPATMPLAGPAGGAAAGAATAATAAPAPIDAAAAVALATKHTCTACHGMEDRRVGPSFRAIADKHGSRADALTYLTGKIRTGGSGVWGAIPMPPQSLAEADAGRIAAWIAGGAPKP